MPFLQLLSTDPNLRLLQLYLLVLAVVAVFLVFFTTRDILLRTRSFLLQFFCIVLVTVLPILGFLIYLLIRPARTVKQRELELLVLEMVRLYRGEEHHTAKHTFKKKQLDIEEDADDEETEHSHKHTKDDDGAKKGKRLK